MIVKFYNIPGISPDNEPYFTSESDRNTQLSPYTVKTWSTSYYPVMYENRIKCTVDEVPLTSVFNYISINMYNKDWFFFVDSIRYINEKIYFVNLTLDAVQTFYFETYIRRFEETRSFTYSGLRDNLSVDSTLHPVSFTDFDENRPYIIVVQYNTRLTFNDCHVVTGINENQEITWVQSNFGWAGFKENVIIKGTEQKMTDSLKTMYIPIPVTDDDYYKFVNPYGVQHIIKMNRIEIFNTVNALANDPNVVNMYVTKITPTAITYGSFYDGDTLRTGYMLNDTCQLFTNWMVKTGYSSSNSDYWLVHYVNKRIYGTFTTPIREICDSNYYQISIGELNDYVIVPIELLQPLTTYNLYCTLDISSGARTYEVDAEPLQTLRFRHICNSLETMSLFNDNYNTYLLQNKGTLTTGIALQKTQAWINFANQVFNQNAAKAFNAGTRGGVAGGIVAGVESNITSGVDMFNTMYGIEKSVQAQKENAYYAPDTVKSGNNYTNDLIHKFIDRVVIVTKVADCDDIQNIRAYIGYLSHNVVSASDMSSMITAYTPVNGKRLVMGTCTLNIRSFNTRDYIVAIKDRFEKGVRFYSSISMLGR